MRKQKQNRKGFTLIELLIVIAIIGILATIVLVSMNEVRNRANRASALSTSSSIMPELMLCLNDEGNINAYDTAAVICDAIGHNVAWPSYGNTGWTNNAQGASPLESDYYFTVTKAGGVDIVCSLANNSCN